MSARARKIPMMSSQVEVWEVENEQTGERSVCSVSHIGSWWLADGNGVQSQGRSREEALEAYVDKSVDPGFGDLTVEDETGQADW